MMPSEEFRLFRDRHDAGQQLARRLGRFKDAKDTTVIALPRGGVIVAYDISLALRLRLDVVITRKLRTPSNPELAMGALAETGYRYMNEDVVREYGITQAEIEQEILFQTIEIGRRIHRYRRSRPLPALKGQTVILVDDGIATGATFFASLSALRAAGAGTVVAAVPVAPPRVVAALQGLVKDVVVLHTSEWFFGIGQFYERFPQVEDHEVTSCLEVVRAAWPTKERSPA